MVVFTRFGVKKIYESPQNPDSIITAHRGS